MTEATKASAALTRVEIFAGLRPDEIDDLMAGAHRHELLDGAVIVHEGDASDSFFVLEQGTVSVRKGEGEQSVELTTLGEGATFGEMGVITGKPRSADVVAKGRAVCWSIPATHFDGRAEEGCAAVSRILRNISRMLAERLDWISVEFAELVRKQQAEGKKRPELQRFKEKLYSEWSF